MSMGLNKNFCRYLIKKLDEIILSEDEEIGVETQHVFIEWGKMQWYKDFDVVPAMVIGNIPIVYFLNNSML